MSQQCQAAGVACFVKQLGDKAIAQTHDDLRIIGSGCHRLLSKKGGDPSEWPADLRVRQFPKPAKEWTLAMRHDALPDRVRRRSVDAVAARHYPGPTAGRFHLDCGSVKAYLEDLLRCDADWLACCCGGDRCCCRRGDRRSKSREECHR